MNKSIACPICSSIDVFCVLYFERLVYICNTCKAHWRPSIERVLPPLRRLEIPIARRAEAELLEKTENKAVLKIGDFYAVLERVERGFIVQIQGEPGEALTPALTFKRVDEFFGRKGAPLRAAIQNRDLFMNFAIAVQRTLSELPAPKAMKAKRAPSIEVEVPGPLLAFKGGIIEGLGLVYEPLGNGLYAWKVNDKRGISKVEAVFERGASRPVAFKLNVNGVEYFFEKSPPHVIKAFLDKLPFRAPDLDFIERWVKGEVKVKSGPELFERVKFYVKVMLDLEEGYDAICLCLYVFQTWLRHILRVAFNIDVGGPFGAGKSTTLESINEICYHPLLGSASAPAIARMNEHYALSWALDEYDRQRTNLADHFVRAGYRDNNVVYRINPKSGRPEGFNPFGPKLISFHETLERALSQRSLCHIKLSKSLDHRLPIINRYREQLSWPLFNDLFVWYMESAVELRKRMMEEYKELEEFKHKSLITVEEGLIDFDSLEDEVNQFRKTFYERITSKLSDDEKGFIQSLSDRPCELAYAAIVISKLIGVEVIKSLREALEVKMLEEQEEELGVDEIVKEVLAEFSDRGEVLQKEVYSEAKRRVKEAVGEALSPHRFKRVLRDLGFREKKSILRRGGGRVLVFSDLIRRKLPRRDEAEGIIHPLKAETFGICELCGKYGVLTHWSIIDKVKRCICQDCAEMMK